MTGATDGHLDADLDAIRDQVICVMEVDLRDAKSRDENAIKIVSVLDSLDAALNQLIARVNKRIQSGTSTDFSAEDWVNGAGIANWSQELTLHFRHFDLLEYENRASEIWARATLAVCSHYRELVGPAMVANASCQERLGNSNRAKNLYSAVVRDMTCVLDEYETDQDEPTDEDTAAIESLMTACDRLDVLKVDDVDGVDVGQLKRQCTEITSRGRR